LYLDNMARPAAAPKASRRDRHAPGGARGAQPRPVATRQVPAVSRAVAILRLLGKSEAPLGLHAIASELGIIPSTCLHILRVLVAEGLVAVDPRDKRYVLAAGVLAIARGVLRKHGFAELAQPRLDALSRLWGASAAGVEALGLNHMVVVAISRPEQGLRLRVGIGSRFPALISATGRCIAAFGDHDAGEIERRFRALRWDNPPSFAAWRTEVEATREAGYAVDDGAYITGVAIIAAPVFARGRPINGLVVMGVGEQLRRIGFTAIGERLRAEAAEMSEALAGAG
jgi:DNA-binding IclR family transcriptional regulator